MSGNWGWSGQGDRALEFPEDGEQVAVSPLGRARLRYNDVTNELQISLNGAAYVALSTGGGGAPAGADTEVQFNDAGAFGADSGFTYDGTDLGLERGILFQQGFLHNIGGVQPAGDGSTFGDEIRIIAPTGQDNSAGPPGTGGKARFNAGRGGDATSGADDGGDGGELQIFGGFGGSATGAGNFGGVGSKITIQSGNGGAASAGATKAGKGGQIDIRAAQGGIGIGVPGGDGGDVFIIGGAGGTFGVTVGGFVDITGGRGANGGADGEVRIATDDTAAVLIGNATDNPPTSFLGTGAVTFNGHSAFAELAGDPGGTANQGKLYTKDVAAVTELFFQRSDGTVVQLS